MAASPSLEPQAWSLTNRNLHHRSCPWRSLSQSCPAVVLFKKVSEDGCNAVQQYFCFLKTAFRVFMVFLMVYISPCYFILASINEVSLKTSVTPAFQWWKDATFGEFLPSTVIIKCIAFPQQLAASQSPIKINQLISLVLIFL